jgi:hypothetical protein
MQLQEDKACAVLCVCQQLHCAAFSHPINGTLLAGWSTGCLPKSSAAVLPRCAATLAQCEGGFYPGLKNYITYQGIP